MNQELCKYARLGLVHHMLYPDCHLDPQYHVDTLRTLVQRDDIETFDCCLPYGEDFRQQIIRAIAESGKTVCFATHFFPMRTFPFAARTPVAKSQVWLLIDDMINTAKSINAQGFIFGSGTPAFPVAVAEDFIAFEEFCCQLCTKLAPLGICAMLEPFDFTIDKKFLYGPIDNCLELAEKITKFHGHDNFAFELDFAHLPLMDEDFQTAVKICAPYLKRVHLGNCLLKDKNHQLYGDKHPPIGFPGGEIDILELAEILRLLLSVGYLSPTKRGDLVLEMIPFPGKSVDFTIEDQFNRLNKAWELV